jgi:PAS domain S-box-containing protein
MVTETSTRPLLREIPFRSAVVRALAVVVLASVYFAAAKFGLALAVFNPSASAVWPPTGIAIAALLLFGPGLWPGILIGAFAANLSTSGALWSSVGIAFGNTLEGVVAAALVTRWAGGARFFEEPRHLFRYAFLAGILAPAISATIGVASLALAGLVPAHPGTVWLTWWLGDAAGALVIAPLILTWRLGRPTRWTLPRVAEALALLAALVLTGLLVFEEAWSAAPNHFPIAYLTFPVLAWSSFRFGAREAITAIAVLAAIAIHGTLVSRGPFTLADLNASLILLQGFIAVAAVLHLAFSASMSRRARDDEHTRGVQEELEQRVRERTRMLEEANQQLRSSQDRLLEAQRVASVGSWEWDIGSDQVWWSEELYRLYGLDRTTFRASYSGFLERVHPDDREKVNARIAAAVENQQPFHFEHRVVRPDGTVITLEAQGRVIRDEAGVLVRMAGTGQDITERKRAEEERSQLLREQIARKEAEEANRMKDAFLATLSHELRTPLNSILGWTGLLGSETTSPEDVRRGLETIRRNALAQSHLISDILDLSSIESGKLALHLVPAELADVIESAIDSVRPEAEKKPLHLAAHLERGRIVRVDVERMRQVVLNLLSNAIKFVPAGGHVDIRLECNAERCRIDVEDDGPGISPELLPHVFDRFRQGDSTSTRQHRGLGLGLAIVQRLVALHGGRVEAANREGGGARITIELLLEPAAPAAASPSGIGKWQTLPVLRGLSLLVVDDDDDSREITAEILRRAGAEVASRASASEARRSIEERLPDVLVTDIEMPGEDGYALIESIRGRRGRLSLLPALALTAYARPEDAARAAKSGFDAFLPKPVDPNALIRRVGALAHSRKPRPA